VRTYYDAERTVLRSEATYVHHQAHGPYREYYESGTLRKEVPFDHGAINGDDRDSGSS
jgi:antitoxin component YwqK of YwqJK toxin-antitoxin module